jgi:hypothetical protein
MPAVLKKYTRDNAALKNAEANILRRNAQSANAETMPKRPQLRWRLWVAR